MTHGQGHRSRLKARYKEAGWSAFSERERLEFLLTFAIPRRDTKPLAIELLQRFGSIERVLDQDLSSLTKVEGIGEHGAILLKISGDLRRTPAKSLVGKKLSGPLDVQDFLCRTLAGKAEEVFCLILLDQGNRILDFKVLEEGIENRAHIYTKKLVRVALDHSATGVICVHNHPGGGGEFSDQDIQLTRQLGEVLRAMEIRLLDHFLLAEDEVISMKSEGISF